MRKSNKTRKKTDADIQIIEKIKECINRYSSASNLIRNVEFEELADKDSLRFSCKIDFGDFEETVVYYSAMLMTEHMIDAEFVYKNSSYIYTFYDIFNLFDIDDFNLYYARDMLSCDDVEKIINDIFNATEKYFNYIEKAGTSKYLPKLIKNYETDMTAVMGGNDWEGEEIYDPFILPFNHPYFSVYDGRITLKLHKKLQKRNSKGELELIYEKRLLKYLDNGNNFERKSISEKTDFEKMYRKREIQLNLCVFLIIFVTEILLSFIIHKMFFYGAEIIRETDVFLSLFPKNMFVLCITAAFLVTLAVLAIFGKKLLTKLMPDDMKNSTERKYEKDSYAHFEKMAKSVKIALCIPLIIISVFALISSVDDIGFYDDHLRFSSGVTLKISDIQYDDLKIYKVLNVYTEEGEFEKLENTYAVAGTNGLYYELGELNPDGEIQARLNEIAEQYNIEIIVIESINDLS